MRAIIYGLFDYLPGDITDKIILLINKIFKRKDIANNIQTLNAFSNKLTKKEFSSFKNFAKYEVQTNRYNDYLTAYIDSGLSLVSGNPEKLKNNKELIMMCAFRDDFNKIKHQYNRMKEFGIKQFIYIDNNSSDNTSEWLSSKKDVLLYRTEKSYNSIRRSAWYRKIISVIGFNRWYLMLDSDEIYMYPGIENDKFNDLINFLESKKLNSMNSILLDLYPKEPIKIKGQSNEALFDKYVYFDTTYKLKHSKTTKVIYGGPRHRVFSSQENVFMNWLNKNNLIKYQEDFFHNSHSLIPYSFNFKVKTAAATLHYKFLPGDFEKFNTIIREGNYNNDSQEYKIYLKNIEASQKINFYSEKSEKLISSHDLLKVNLIDKFF